MVDDEIESAASSYIHDIYLDESKSRVDRVIEHLKAYRLKSKPPESLRNPSVFAFWD